MFRILLKYLTHGLGLLAGLGVALMMFHVMADVIGKYVFKYPVPSTAAVVANYYMISVVFLSLAWVEARSSAISVDIIYDAVSPARQRLMRKFGEVVTLLFYLVFGWFSWVEAIRAWKVNESVDGLWRVTIWPAKFMLPIGIAVACLVLIGKICCEPAVRERVVGGRGEHPDAEA